MRDFLLQNEKHWSIYALPDGNDFKSATGASGCSSGVEHNLAKVGVEGSNPFARSSPDIQALKIPALTGIFAFQS